MFSRFFHIVARNPVHTTANRHYTLRQIVEHAPTTPSVGRDSVATISTSFTRPTQYQRMINLSAAYRSQHQQVESVTNVQNKRALSHNQQKPRLETYDENSAQSFRLLG